MASRAGAGTDTEAEAGQVGEEPLEVEGGQRRGHILRGLLQVEPELYLPGMPGILGARQARVPQGQGQPRPFQPQLHREWGAPGGHLEGQDEGLPIAEPLISQEFLWCCELLLVFWAQEDPIWAPLWGVLGAPHTSGPPAFGSLVEIGEDVMHLELGSSRAHLGVAIAETAAAADRIVGLQVKSPGATSVT